MKANADSKKSSRPSAGNSSSISNSRCRPSLDFRSSVRRRPIWLRTRRISGLVRLRSEEHTSELQSLMRISYAVFCLKKKNIHNVLHYNLGSRATHMEVNPELQPT